MIVVKDGGLVVAQKDGCAVPYLIWFGDMRDFLVRNDYVPTLSVDMLVGVGDDWKTIQFAFPDAKGRDLISARLATAERVDQTIHPAANAGRHPNKITSDPFTVMTGRAVKKPWQKRFRQVNRTKDITSEGR